jgi:hypothetical protein
LFRRFLTAYRTGLLSHAFCNALEGSDDFVPTGSHPPAKPTLRVILSTIGDFIRRWSTPDNADGRSREDISPTEVIIIAWVVPGVRITVAGDTNPKMAENWVLRSEGSV